MSDYAIDDGAAPQQEGHQVDPSAGPMKQIRQMLAAHDLQRQREAELERMAWKLETRSEVSTWFSAAASIPDIDLVRVAESVPVSLRGALPPNIQEAIIERVRARMGLY